MRRNHQGIRNEKARREGGLAGLCLHVLGTYNAFRDGAQIESHKNMSGS
ncbi:hypothetical protein SAMN05216387_102426 [Nitrosovibrio tenuis]|uniref:Transposase n=1 Tax=Nitrosovibrio tenuis TaxID=1233 RepID=A0A1H7JD66_9PROT|nr:hypothetical protein SAMN05216387_102426 [Nitrosovibrio tenuis]